MGTIRTEPSPSKSKASPSDEIVELKPPPEFGFSGTVKYYAAEHSALIVELLKRGYTRVDRDRG